VPQLVGCFNVLLGTAVVLAGVSIKLCAHEPIEDDLFPVPQLVVFMFVYDFVFPAIKVVLARVAIKLCTHEPIEDDFFPVDKFLVLVIVFTHVFPAITYLAIKYLIEYQSTGKLFPSLVRSARELGGG